MAYIRVCHPSGVTRAVALSCTTVDGLSARRVRGMDTPNQAFCECIKSSKPQVVVNSYGGFGSVQ